MQRIASRFIGRGFGFSRFDAMGSPVLKLINKGITNRADPFLTGVTTNALGPASINKAQRFAKETGLDLFMKEENIE